MKKLFTKLLVIAMSVACTGLLIGCGQNTAQVSDKEAEPDSKVEKSNTTEEEQDTEAALETSIITEYNWQASGDSSLIVCETDGSFKYYRSAEDLTNYYYEGTYEFYVGEKAVTYVTTELSDYDVTKEELEDLFDGNEVYDESNFVVLVLNNEACIVDGENQVESPYRTPYYGSCVESDGVPCLDIVNMNSANRYLFMGK